MVSFPPRHLCSFQVYWQQMTHFTSAQDDCFTTLPAASGLKRGYSGSNWWNNFYSCAYTDHACNTQRLRLKTNWKPAKHLDVTWKSKTLLWPQAWLPWRGKICHKIMPCEVFWARHPQSWVGTSGKLSSYSHPHELFESVWDSIA